MADMGASLVIESREHAEKRGAKPLARLVAIQSDRNRRKPGEIETTIATEWAAIEPQVKKDQAVVISGASGLEPPIQLATSKPTPSSDERARKLVPMDEPRERLRMDAEVHRALIGCEDVWPPAHRG